MQRRGRRLLWWLSLIHISGASQCYAGQIRELFGDLVEVYSYSTSDQSVEKITRTDLYLVSTDAFKIAEEESQYVPADGQVVEIYVGYSKEVIRRLKEIPAGTRVLFVNVTHQMAREAITQLEQSGVNQLQFIPYGPDVFTMEPTFGDDVVPENVKLAVTPDEMDFVPAGLEQVINIGHRPLSLIHIWKLIDTRQIENQYKTNTKPI